MRCSLCGRPVEDRGPQNRLVWRPDEYVHEECAQACAELATDAALARLYEHPTSEIFPSWPVDEENHRTRNFRHSAY